MKTIRRNAHKQIAAIRERCTKCFVFSQEN